MHVDYIALFHTIQLIVLGLAACAAASGESYQWVNRYDGYDRVPSTYDVRVKGYNADVGRLGKRSIHSYVPAGGYGYDQYPGDHRRVKRSPALGPLNQVNFPIGAGALTLSGGLTKFALFNLALG